MKRARTGACAAIFLVLSGCAEYTGTGTAISPVALASDPGWTAVGGVPVLHQRSEHDCGPTALAMVLARWARETPAISGSSATEDRRYTAGELRDRARSLGFSSFVVAGTLDDIVHELEQGRPMIVGMAKPTLKGPVAHFEVVVGLDRAGARIATIDPALGFRQNSLQGFLGEWVPAGQVLLVVLGPDGDAAAPHRVDRRPHHVD